MARPVTDNPMTSAPEPDALKNLTIVVPVLNAGATLGATLAAVAESDVVVVDGSSQDDSTTIAANAGARVVTAPRGRGQQLAAGAEAASGDWLLFLHGDTRLGSGWREAVHSFVTDPAHRTKAAVFRFQLDDGRWRARLMAWGVARRGRLFGLPYGDQGLLIHRDLYEAVGGFKPLPLMEDVDLVRRLGRSRLVFLPVDAVTSAARYRRDGYVFRAARNLTCLALYLMGANVGLIRRVYGA
jgi:rSAM/selenodomain-associated transferase 2